MPLLANTIAKVMGDELAKELCHQEATRDADSIGVAPDEGLSNG